MNKPPDSSSRKPVEADVSASATSQTHKEPDSDSLDPVTERISNFFTKWSRLPNDQSECLSDAKLVLIAQEHERLRWPTHVQECSICSKVVQLIQNSKSERKSVLEFLTKTRAIAKDDYVSERFEKSSMWNYLRAFYRGWSPSSTVAGVLVLLSFVALGVWSTTHSLEPAKSSYTAVLGEDPYQKTEEWFRASVEIMENPSLSPEKKISNLEPLKIQYSFIQQSVASIQSSKLDPVRRAELAKLVSEFNSQTRLLRADLQKTRTGSNFEVRDVPQSPDSKIVTQICAAVTVKTDSSSVKSEAKTEEQDIQAARAVIEGARQLNFASVDDKQIIVQDLIVNRSLSDRQEIGERLKAIEYASNVKITLSVDPIASPQGLLDSKSTTRYQDLKAKKKE